MRAYLQTDVLLETRFFRHDPGPFGLSVVQKAPKLQVQGQSHEGEVARCVCDVVLQPGLGSSPTVLPRTWCLHPRVREGLWGHTPGTCGSPRGRWAGDEQPPVLLADGERRSSCPPAPAEHPQGDRVTGLKPAKPSQLCGLFPSKYFCWDA